MKLLRLLALAFFAVAAPAFAGDFKAGAAAVVITPPLGTVINGNFRPIIAENVHDELRSECAVDDLLCGAADGLSALRRDSAEVAVGLGGGSLDHADGADKRGVSAEPADGEILNGAGGLRAIESGGWDLNIAEGVFFGAGVRHAGLS